MTSLMTSADPAWRRSAARRASSSAQPLWGIAGTYLAICAREGHRARAPAGAARRGALVVQELLAQELPGAGTAGPGTAAQELRSRKPGQGTGGPGTAVQEPIAPRGMPMSVWSCVALLTWHVAIPYPPSYHVCFGTAAGARDQRALLARPCGQRVCSLCALPCLRLPRALRRVPGTQVASPPADRRTARAQLSRKGTRRGREGCAARFLGLTHSRTRTSRLVWLPCASLSPGARGCRRARAYLVR
jgi:hypothetical protein